MKYKTIKGFEFISLFESNIEQCSAVKSNVFGLKLYYSILYCLHLYHHFDMLTRPVEQIFQKSLKEKVMNK